MSSRTYINSKGKSKPNPYWDFNATNKGVL